jgi:hypothetical protein
VVSRRSQLRHFPVSREISGFSYFWPIFVLREVSLVGSELSEEHKLKLHVRRVTDQDSSVA